VSRANRVLFVLVMSSVISLAVSASAGAGSIFGPPIPYVTKNKSFEFNEYEVDFGKVEQMTSREFKFEFENKGDTPIDIVSLKPSCGCTEFSFPSQRVQPGEKGVIEGICNFGRFKNKIRKSITLKVRDPISGVDPSVYDEEKYPTARISLRLKAFVNYDNKKQPALRH